MLNLNDVFYFVQVVNHGGFTAAGRALRMPKSTLSYRVQQLEEALSVRLLNRSSRKLGLTDVGGEFYGHAQSLLREADAAESVARRRLTEPSGTIRISTSVAVAQFALRDILPLFMQKFSKVAIVHHATDLVGEGYDIAIRAHTGALPDSSLIQRPLAEVPWQLFAGKSYLAHAGTPRQPDDLWQYSAIALGHDTIQQWQLRRDDAPPIIVPINVRYASNDMVALKQAACAGLGIVALPTYLCGDEVRSGALVRLLPDWRTADSRLSALIPFRQGWLPSVRALLDFLVTELPQAVNEDFT